MYYEESSEIMIGYQDILSGVYDGYIERCANVIKEFGNPVLIRFAHEMNIERYHWGTPREEYGRESPLIYKKMHKHVRDIFREAKADNAVWVFCPNAESVPNKEYDPTTEWNSISNYYPGDESIDIVGIDGYNWGTSKTIERDGWKSEWKSFREIFEPAFRELRLISPCKPVLVFETSTLSEDSSGRIQWIKDMLSTSEKWQLTGIIWFQALKELDWRLLYGRDDAGIAAINEHHSPSHNWMKGLMK